jgi:hypothetical protein
LGHIGVIESKTEDWHYCELLARANARNNDSQTKTLPNRIDLSLTNERSRCLTIKYFSDKVTIVK